MSIFKELGTQDSVSTKTLLHEAIPITGTILSGTYVIGATATEENIKNYAHGMFQSIFDYPFLSSSANHIFDISVGTSANGLTVTNQAAKKDNVYNQMAQVLAGYDKDGNIQRFDEDGNLTGGTKLDDVFFLTFSRLLTKDEIMKGTFSLELGVHPSGAVGNFEGHSVFGSRILITDASGSTNYKINSPAGEYGILFATQSAAAPSVNGVLNGHSFPVGLIYYQAGVAVISGSVFNSSDIGGILKDQSAGTSTCVMGSPAHPDIGQSGFNFITGSEISSSADAIRARIFNVSFNNTIELNSTIYFCRINHNEYNYSSNPTYLSGSEIRVKTNRTDPPISYITSIGLYSSDNQLLAVGKFSEPVRKDSNIELTFRARLDY